MSSIETQNTQSSASETDSELQRNSTVMMVDDESITLDVVQAFLEEAGYRKFVTTSEPASALDLLETERPDVVLLDLMMPVVSGFDILKRMREDARFKRVPVIVLTSSTDAETKLKALEMGATDFLGKPVDASELVLRLRNTLAAKAYLDQVTYFDSLTGLHNRRMFIDHMDWTLNQAKRYGRTGAMLHINIDRFRKFNEALGPALGDEFLKAAAIRLQQCIRSSDTLALIGEHKDVPSLSRLGSDEFAVLLVEIDKIEGATMVAQRLLAVMMAPFRVGEHELLTTCSIGISVFPADSMDRDALVQGAAVALQAVKQQGGNNYCFFSSDLNDRSLQLLKLHGGLRGAIDNDELCLFYQPKIDTETKRLVGAEALVRWNHPERGLVSPAQFIPLAEESGLIVDIGAWVFEEACRQISVWQADGLSAPKIAVNISGRHFSEKNFLASIRDILARSGVDPGHLQIELTESVLMGNARENILVLKQLKDIGLNLSIDDFGTGYSSLSYLRRFPIDELKIDRSFLTEIDVKGNDNSASIVVAIIALAHGLKLRVVAEGVETEAQWAFLRDNGCDVCQGFLFNKPMPAEKFTAFITDQAIRRKDP